MKNLYHLKRIFVTLLTFVFTQVIAAQTGNIQGTITDENGISVPGANVVIPSLGKGAISDFDGRFTLVNIPEGNYQIKLTYLGYADEEQEVSVTAGETTSVSINLSPKSVELDAVEVTGYGFSSQARALNTQKTNMNITNVVSTEQIGNWRCRKTYSRNYHAGRSRGGKKYNRSRIISTIKLSYFKWQ